MSETSLEPWIIRPRPSPNASAWLLCFGFAGSNTSLFHHWPQGLPDAIDVCAVQLPGRQRRFHEKPATRLLPLAETIAEFVSPRLSGPFAVLGACTGAFLAFEVTRAIRERTGREPFHFFVTSCPAPHLPARDTPAHLLSDSELIERLRLLGGTDLDVLQHSEFMKMILGTIRADFEVVETYPRADFKPFRCPITAVLGEDDAFVEFEEISAWREHTLGPFKLLTLPAGHFLVETHRELLLQTLIDDMHPDSSRGVSPVADRTSRPSFRQRKDQLPR
ncbi:MAG: thioesterase II family protein [Isosphaeraceae bacterium]